MSEDVKKNAVYYANKALSMFGLTNDEICVYIEGFVNRSYSCIGLGRCDCVIVDQTVSDDTLVKKCSQRAFHCSYGQHYYLCFALKGLKIGVYWNGKPY